MYGVKLTPFSEIFLLTPDWKKLKELFFRSNNDPKFGVELGVLSNPIKGVIIHSKYFADSDWLKAQA